MNDEVEDAIKEFRKLVLLRKNKRGDIKYDNCIVSTTQLETVLNHIKELEAKEIEKTNLKIAKLEYQLLDSTANIN